MIEVIFSSQDEGDTTRRLLGDDAQVFVDVIDEARSTTPCEYVLIETDIDMFYQPGAGQTRPFATGPRELSQIVVQNVRPPCTPSNILEDSGFF